MKNRIVCCTAALLLAAGGLGALPQGTLNTAIVVSAYEKGWFTYDDKDIQTKDGFTYIIWGKDYAGSWSDFYHETEHYGKDMEGAVEILDYKVTGDTMEFPDEIDGHPVKVIACSPLIESKVKKVKLPKDLDCFYDHYEENETFDCGPGSTADITVLRKIESLEAVEKEQGGVDGFYSQNNMLFRSYGYVKGYDSDEYDGKKELAFVPAAITDVAIPDDTKVIGYEAFKDCTAENVDIPDGVLLIDSFAFTDSDTKSVIIPKSVERMGAYVFEDSGVTSVDIQTKIEVLPEGTFNRAYSLENVTLPNTLKTIGSQAFEVCTSLKSIEIPDSVTVIGSWAFHLCDSLSEVKMSNKTERIEDYAFGICPNLRSMTLPKTIKYIGKKAIGYADIDKKNEDFVLRCHPGTGANYAVRNGLKYELLSPAYSMKNAKITLTGGSRYVYTGKAVKPEFTVTLNSKTFKKGLHYTVSYKANKAPGKAKVIVDGIGSYAGHLGKTFYISPRQMTAKKLTTPKKGAVKLYWNQDKTADGYQIIVKSKGFAKDSKNVTIKKNSTVAKTVTGLKSGRKYAVKIRAYKTVDGRKLYGKCSKTLSIKCR